jgi:uncharacterized phage infection (PIP) family protein YhgE
MWRHAWFKILVGLQLLNFAAIALIEQQRRTIWDKEATNAQRILDTRIFTEKTEANYQYVAKQLADISERVSRIQNAENLTKQFEDLRDRISAAHNEVLGKSGDASKQFTDLRERLALLNNGAEQNAANAANQFTDLRDRLTELQRGAENNAGNAALIKDIRERVLHIEAVVQKLQPADRAAK